MTSASKIKAVIESSEVIGESYVQYMIRVCHQPGGGVGGRGGDLRQKCYFIFIIFLK